jgi:hypothetical protein
MAQPWHDINDPGGFSGKNETQKSSKAVEVESIQPEAAEKQEPEVKLISAQWDPGSEGFEFNKKCGLKITAEFLRETFRKKVTCSLFSMYEGVEEDLNHQVETELDAEHQGTTGGSMTLHVKR